MKKLLYLFLFIPFTFLGQGFLAIEQDSHLELYEGWNMFGYSCYEPIDVALSFTSIEDKIVIVKDNGGNVYMPEFGFNGIGSLERNLGYQIKLTESITDFQFCPFLVPLVEGCSDSTAFNFNPNANSDDGSCYPFIYGCIDPSAFNYNDIDGDGVGDYFTGINGIDINTDDGSCFPVILGCLDIEAYNYNDYNGDGVADELTGINGVDVNTDDGSCVPFIYGCTDQTAYNYNPEANTDDGFCVEVVFGCMDSLACNFNSDANMADGNCEYVELGYDCDGNLVEYVVGMEAEGGIVFYVNETGERGLVCAMEDLVAVNWGCSGINIDGAELVEIGFGFQNTLDIIADCSENPIAASQTLGFESGGYSDWYLPSFYELREIYLMINQNTEIADLGGFTDDWYMSSSEYSSFQYWDLHFLNGNPGGAVKVIPIQERWIRPIRAFGNWTMGCMDETALNYNPEANMADGYCIAAIEGCTDETALNFNENANVDDESCVPFIYGCTDQTAYNYNPEANTDDGFCVEVVSGCMDSLACNFNPDALTEIASMLS